MTAQIQIKTWRPWCIFALVILAASCMRNDKTRLEDCLGVRLPPDGSGVRLNLVRRKDYDFVELHARFDLPRERLAEFASSLKLTPFEFSLPTENIPAEIREWWDVPPRELQAERLWVKNSRGILYALWWNGRVYVEFSGYPPAKGYEER
jgi:hypothetical protein